MKKVFIVLLVIALFGGGLLYLRQRSVSKGSSSTLTVPEMKTRVDPFPNDKDRDGISNDEEKKMGTSDVSFDTDHDGLSDTDEIRIWKTDPTKADTDGDGHSDGVEVLNGFNPNGAGMLKN